MKILRLQASGFKRLKAIDISPEGGLVEVRGNNGHGKTSVLDAIRAALGGGDVAPVKPVRTGEEYAIIRADLGDLKVTRYFGEDGTTSLKVENAEGFKPDRPQERLDGLIGRISFDPLAFARMAPKEQAAELRKLVPLSVDLDALAAEDKADMTQRRDINRDAKTILAQRDAIIVPADLPAERPDRDALVSELAGAADTNRALDQDRFFRESEERKAIAHVEEGDRLITRAEALRAQAAQCDADAVTRRGEAELIRESLAALNPLADPVDTADLRSKIEDADRVLRLFAEKDKHAALTDRFEGLRGQSEALTEKMTKRAEERAKALAEAKMPVDGLSFADFDGEQLVTFNGEPFAQSSGAEQLRVSMQIAMAANPKLRVMLIKDGSLLDKTGLEIVRELADGRGYQVWLEAVGEEGSGIIMEDGQVRGADEPERVDPPKRRTKKDAGEPIVHSKTGEVIGRHLPSGAMVIDDPHSIESSEAVASPAVTPPAGQGEGGVAPNAPSPDPVPAKPGPKPKAMREFSSKPAGGGDDLFGGNS